MNWKRQEWKIVGISIVALIIVASSMIYFITKEEPVYHTLSGHLTGWQEFTYGTDSEQRSEGFLLVIEDSIFNGDYFTVQTEHWFYHIGKYYLYSLDSYIGKNITIHYHALNNKAYIDAIEITKNPGVIV